MTPVNGGVYLSLHFSEVGLPCRGTTGEKTMIRLGDKIRLNPREKRSYAVLTDGMPSPTTAEGLNKSLDAAKLSYPGETAEEKLLRHLLDQSKV